MPGLLTASKGFFGSVGKTGTSPGLTSSAKAELKTSLHFGEEEDIPDQFLSLLDGISLPVILSGKSPGLPGKHAGRVPGNFDKPHCSPLRTGPVHGREPPLLFQNGVLGAVVSIHNACTFAVTRLLQEPFWQVPPDSDFQSCHR